MCAVYLKCKTRGGFDRWEFLQDLPGLLCQGIAELCSHAAEVGSVLDQGGARGGVGNDVDDDEMFDAELDEGGPSKPTSDFNPQVGESFVPASTLQVCPSIHSFQCFGT
jgi:hypothetical protein